VISNATIAGPKVTSSTTINANYKRGAHLRRNTQESLFNTVIMGYPSGLMIDGSTTETNATSELLQVRNTVIAGCTNNFEVASGSTFDISGWFNTSGFGNATYTNNTDVMLTDAFNLTAPNAVPLAGSPLLAGADFTTSKVADPFFEVVTYRGAFGTTDWTLGWTNWTPNETSYTAISDIKFISGLNLYPNPMSTQATLELNLLEANRVTISITDLSGRMISEVLNEQMAAGNHSITVQTPNLPTGMYFLLVRSGSEKPGDKDQYSRIDFFYVFEMPSCQGRVAFLFYEVKTPIIPVNGSVIWQIPKLPAYTDE
jgi:hypothetical protein